MANGKFVNAGAAWKKVAKNGEPYISLSLDVAIFKRIVQHLQAEGKWDGKAVNLTVWKNKYKKEERHPDYQLPAPEWLRAEEVAKEQNEFPAGLSDDKQSQVQAVKDIFGDDGDHEDDPFA